LQPPVDDVAHAAFVAAAMALADQQRKTRDGLMASRQAATATAENPEGFRTDVKKAPLNLTDDYNLPGISPDTAKVARDTAK
jgi:hypothetical protein